MQEINKVMIIDDKETFIFPLEMGLKKRGIDVISFTEPEEAIEYLKSNTIHVLLTDYHMEPNINGDEVIRRVREFNKDIIIYLQTGYAETLPADEMLDKYDIQGYIDKGEGQEKNIQLVKASLKQAKLIETVKRQKQEINQLEYSKEFLGRFLGNILGQIREESMVIGPLSNILASNEEFTEEERKRFAEDINIAIGKLGEMTKTMEFDNLGEITISKLNETLNNLLDIELKMKYAKINLKYSEDKILKCDSKILIYMLVEIIETILENEKDININIESSSIIIENEINSVELVNKLNRLAEFDSNFKIKNINNQINILI